ncbi:hypothetical protein POM88_048531 [Heracleum sosnowskyi]|uniref:Uncharacterized protein n=1 Tax=Heracleum sosnowskyi TaxID=360622 RepID=A0AAD8LYK1_9APIA|nr:hypothetical protein POM88_048531 [Heracleum sosnowskyi]
MASSSFMNKQTVISGVTFATNNFVDILNHQDLPNEFHIIQDFLASSPLKFALTEPASVSFKSVMQVWNSVTFDKGTKLKKEWNFFFDTISRCFLNKTSNFDALPSGSLKIGITENNIKFLVNSDKTNGFIGNAFIPDETLVVKAKKSARTDVSGRQSGSKDFSSTPLTKNKLQGGVQGVLVKKAAKEGEAVSVKRKLVLRDETDSDDDLPISSVMNVNKEVADTTTAVVVPLSTPQKKMKLSKSRYHIPLEKKQDTDVQDTSILNEQSVSTAQANHVVSIPDAAPSQVVNISDSPAQDSPTKRHVDISWEKYGAAASNLGIKHPMAKLRKAEELVYQRQKKLKGSSPKEPEPQSGSAALFDDPATQEPLNQSLSEGLASGMVPQEPFSQRENADIDIPATQEPSSQSEDAGQATVSEKFPDNAQGISGADEVQRLVEDTVNEGSTQEPLTQSVDAASEPQAPQEPLVANTDASILNPDGVHPDASGAPDAEPILIQPLRSRPMDHPVTDSQDKMKGIAIPDPDVTHSTDDSDDDENRKEKEHLATTLKISLGTNFGSSMKSIENPDLKNHLITTTLLSKSLKSDIDFIKNSTELVTNDISQNFTKVPTTFQLRVVESQVKSVISEQTSINRRIDSLDTKVTDIQASLSLILNLLSNPDVKKGEKVSQTKCTPDLVLRNNDDDDDTGDDGCDKVIQGETSDVAVMKSTIQTSQSQTTQSTHVSDSGVTTVRTLVQSQILMEEQILTGDQIMMHSHEQTLATIPEGDEDIFIDNPEDASNLFQKFSTKDGRIVTLYHTDKRVQQLFARKALSTASEEYPDLSDKYSYLRCVRNEVKQLECKLELK